MDHADIVTSVQPHPTTANQMLSSSADCTIKTWDVEAASTPERTFKSHSPAWCAAWGPSTILAGYQDGYLRFWDARADSNSEMDTSTSSSSSSKPSAITYLAAPIFSLAWHPTSEHLCVAGTEDGSIYGFDNRNLKQPFVTNTDHLSSVRALEFSRDPSPLLFSASDDTSSRLFDLSSSTKSTTSLLTSKIGRAVQQECRDRSRMPSSA
eukprot:TRINITY_DN20762_c0_g1_i11.p1 TRINITY_DN20762_c0_g1~~TRINITY_DN20762_c0_g1_i11.p1  ORF type:complete len:209 (-),score=24.23 TRINITY_DN20762_c0_g1_i11:11-637(-)